MPLAVFVLVLAEQIEAEERSRAQRRIRVVQIDALGSHRTVFARFVERIEHRDDARVQNAVGLTDFENRIVGRPPAEDRVAGIVGRGRSGDQKKRQSEASVNHR